MILDDSFGDTITNMTSFRYNGHFLMSVKLVMQVHGVMFIIVYIDGMKRRDSMNLI